MSGHSKWANIKNRKGAQDKKRSEAFTKMARNIMTALRTGTGLQEAIARAREVNMPKENIERLLTRFEERKGNLESAMFEGFGPFGVPVMIEVETDNKNRILGEIRLIFRNYGGNLGEEGSVGFLFDRVGEIEVEVLGEENELRLIDEGAKDFEGETIMTDVADLKRLSSMAVGLGLNVIGSKIVMRPKQPIMLNSNEELDKIMEMIGELEDNDDVVNVFAGFDYHE
jgi:YebC/PmpR family DNA-binding regulatory protein